MTLPLSHQNGTSVHHNFNISNNQQLENRSNNDESPPVMKMPLLEAFERFKAAFNTGTTAKLIINKDLRIIDVNKSFKSLTGCCFSGTIKGASIEELNIFKRSAIDEFRKRILAGAEDEVYRFITDISLAENIKHLQVSVSSISIESSGAPEQFMVDLADITELEQSKTGWSESRLLLEKQDVEFKNMAKIISHDLRAPATNISNLIGLIESASEYPIDPQLIDGLKASASAILNTLDNTGLQLNTHLKNAASISFNSIGQSINDVIEGINSIEGLSEANIKVKAYDNSDWNIPDELLKMVLFQLVSNSFKFRNLNKTLIINITAFHQGGKRIIKVIDNGVGINLKDQEQRLFGLFQTFHSRPEARGVGLFQVKNRMKSIGGDVLLESEVGVGTTVTLNFN